MCVCVCVCSGVDASVSFVFDGTDCSDTLRLKDYLMPVTQDTHTHVYTHTRLHTHVYTHTHLHTHVYTHTRNKGANRDSG